MTGSDSTQGLLASRLVPVLFLLLAATGAIAVLGFAVAQRIGAPFALEWQEPAMLEHALRVRAGAALYAEPSLKFAPFPYPPLFHWLGALSCGLLGPSLLALRLVSVLGLLMVFGALLGSFRWIAGIAAFGWFAATYGWTGFWLDVARVDTLALGFGALGFAAVLHAEKRSRSNAMSASILFAVIGGVALALAVLTKQTLLGLAVALFAALVLRSGTRRAGAVYIAAFAIVLAPVVLWLEYASSGWFLWTTVDLLRGSPFHAPAILGFWRESAMVLGLPIGLGALAWITQGERSGSSRESSPTFSLALLLGSAALVLSGWAGRAHEGGFDNTLLPVALASAFASGGVLRTLWRGPRGRWTGMLPMVTTTFLMVPSPSSVIPNENDQEAYDEALIRVGALADDGDVWQPVSALPSQRPGFVHKMAIVDIAKSRETEVAARFLDELRAALKERRFSAIVLGTLPREGWGDLGSLIESNYEVTADLEGRGAGTATRAPLTPVTGAPVKPRYVLTPRLR